MGLTRKKIAQKERVLDQMRAVVTIRNVRKKGVEEEMGSEKGGKIGECGQLMEMRNERVRNGEGARGKGDQDHAIELECVVRIDEGGKSEIGGPDRGLAV
jgi:hypothetical protein